MVEIPDKFTAAAPTCNAANVGTGVITHDIMVLRMEVSEQLSMASSQSRCDDGRATALTAMRSARIIAEFTRRPHCMTGVIIDGLRLRPDGAKGIYREHI